MEDTLTWIEEDDYAFDTLHTISKESATKILKALYDEYPGGLEEITAAFRSQQSGSRKKLEAAHQVIRELSALTKELVQKEMIYVLTEEHNAYDQYGEYFVHAWAGKPTKEELALHVLPGTDLGWLDSGGGRIKVENHWYNLREVK